MKKSLKKLMSPPQSFEEWAEQNSVPLEKSAATVRYGGTIRFAVACCSLLLIVFSFVVLFKQHTTDQADNTLKSYSTADVIHKIIDLDTLYQTDGLILFDRNTVMHTQRVTVDVAKDNETLTLGYNTYAMLVAIGDSAFFVDYTARVYSHYDFFDVLSFTDMQELATFRDTTVMYKQKNNTSFLQFSKNNIDYFLTVTNFEDGVALHSSELLLLIGSLLG